MAIMSMYVVCFRQPDVSYFCSNVLSLCVASRVVDSSVNVSSVMAGSYGLE